MSADGGSVTCQVDECQYPSYRRGLCNRHHKRARKAGTLPPLPTFDERFWAKVNKTESCWLWIAATSPSGYGVIKLSGAGTTVAHRAAYSMLVGPIPDGLQLDHLCRVRNCVNPSHLEPVTSAENSRRGMSPFAINARRTHCVNGHPFDEQNTYWRPDGKGRECHTCLLQRARRRYGAA